ncbi:MAG TPA: peptidoglycan DD-metalloendopeptidase family protein, partial [Candidatus Binataceae bacterium]
LTLDRSAYLDTYLVDAGLERAEAKRWLSRFQAAAETRILRRGHSLTLYKDPETGDLRGLRYDLDDHMSVAEANLGSGVLKASTQPIQYTTKPVTLTFAIQDSFRRAAAKNGIPAPIIETLEDAFAGRRSLDDLRPGSAIKLIYQEKVSWDGKYHLVGDIEAAQIRSGNRTLSAFAFRDEHGRAHLYDEEGQALGPQFLRFPLTFKYISSGFTAHRYHPLLHTYRPHVGVDLVAQYGTPVKAIADGRVENAGWAGELGQCVRLEHERGMVSIYGHLSQISPDIRPNGFVRMGQVIGLVGSSGLSTGAHLHFALEKQGNYVNPLSQSLGVHHQVSPRMKALFQNIKHRYETVLASLPDLGSHLVAVEARKPPISSLADMYHVSLNRPNLSENSMNARHHRASLQRDGIVRTVATSSGGDSAF